MVSNIPFGSYQPEWKDYLKKYSLSIRQKRLILRLQKVLLNFRLEFPKSDLTIYLPSGISEIFCQMVSTPFVSSFLKIVPGCRVSRHDKNEMRNKQMRIIVSIKNNSFLHRLKGIIKHMSHSTKTSLQRCSIRWFWLRNFPRCNQNAVLEIPLRPRTKLPDCWTGSASSSQLLPCSPIWSHLK